MAAQRVPVPPHDISASADPENVQLGLDLRAAVCSDAPLLISGSRDVARLVARVVHDHNPHQRAARFVSVTADSLDEKLAAVPLPHGRGLGRVFDVETEGDGLTLFVDDVDRLSLPAQDMLMYLLDVVYASTPVTPATRGREVRVIAATSQDLTARVLAGSFRSDLLYRLNVIHLSMPPTWQAGERQLHVLIATLSA